MPASWHHLTMLPTARCERAIRPSTHRPRPPDDAALNEMGCSIVEEYMRMGWTGENILRLFRNPAFHMTHNILRLKGEAYVQGLAASVDQMRSELQRSGDGS